MIPRTLFDADLEGFRDSVRKFLEQEATPYHDQWEKDGQVSRELWQKAGELGFLCPCLRRLPPPVRPPCRPYLSPPAVFRRHFFLFSPL